MNFRNKHHRSDLGTSTTTLHGYSHHLSRNVDPTKRHLTINRVPGYINTGNNRPTAPIRVPYLKPLPATTTQSDSEERPKRYRKRGKRKYKVKTNVKTKVNKPQFINRNNNHTPLVLTATIDQAPAKPTPAPITPSYKILDKNMLVTKDHPLYELLLRYFGLPDYTPLIKEVVTISSKYNMGTYGAVKDAQIQDIAIIQSVALLTATTIDYVNLRTDTLLWTSPITTTWTHQHQHHYRIVAYNNKYSIENIVEQYPKYVVTLHCEPSLISWTITHNAKMIKVRYIPHDEYPQMHVEGNGVITEPLMNRPTSTSGNRDDHVVTTRLANNNHISIHNHPINRSNPLHRVVSNETVDTNNNGENHSVDQAEEEPTPRPVLPPRLLGRMGYERRPEGNNNRNPRNPRSPGPATGPTPDQDDFHLVTMSINPNSLALHKKARLQQRIKNIISTANLHNAQVIMVQESKLYPHITKKFDAGHGVGLVCKTGTETTVGDILSNLDSQHHAVSEVMDPLYKPDDDSIDPTTLSKDQIAQIRRKHKLVEGKYPRITMMEALQYFYFLTTIGSIFCFIFFVTWGLQWWQWWQSSVNAYTATFSNAPEGLILSLSFCIVLGLRQLRIASMAVKTHDAVELMSMTTDLIIGKTHTITTDKLRVAKIYSPDGHTMLNLLAEGYIASPLRSQLLRRRNDNGEHAIDTSLLYQNDSILHNNNNHDGPSLTANTAASAIEMQQIAHHLQRQMAIVNAPSFSENDQSTEQQLPNISDHVVFSDLPALFGFRDLELEAEQNRIERSYQRHEADNNNEHSKNQPSRLGSRSHTLKSGTHHTGGANLRLRNNYIHTGTANGPIRSNSTSHIATSISKSQHHHNNINHHHRSTSKHRDRDDEHTDHDDDGDHHKGQTRTRNNSRSRNIPSISHSHHGKHTDVSPPSHIRRGGGGGGNKSKTTGTGISTTLQPPSLMMKSSLASKHADFPSVSRQISYSHMSLDSSLHGTHHGSDDDDDDDGIDDHHPHDETSILGAHNLGEHRDTAPNQIEQATGFSLYHWIIACIALTSFSDSLSRQREDLLNATDSCLAQWVKTRVDVVNLIAVNRCVLYVPFNPREMVSLAVYQQPNQQFFCVIKGSPENTIQVCTKYVNNDNAIVPMTIQKHQELTRRVANMCETGNRIIGLAMIHFDPIAFPPDHVFSYYPPTFSLTNAIFLGFVSLEDPIKNEAKEGLIESYNAGLRICLATTDHPKTLLALARKSGYLPPGELTLEEHAISKGLPVNMVGRRRADESELKAMIRTRKPFNFHTDVALFTAEEASQYSFSDWDDILDHKYIIFARIMPQQKMDLVLHLQRHERVVAMTGDRLLDAQALRQADVGIALHYAATVAKDAASVNQRDNSLLTTISGLILARANMDNCRKSIGYILQKLLMELFASTLIQNVFNIPSPSTTMILMYVDSVIDIWPATALIYEETEQMTRRTPPKGLYDSIVGRNMVINSYIIVGMIQTAGVMAIYAIQYYLYDISMFDIAFKAHLYFGEDPPGQPLYLGYSLEERNQIWLEVKAGCLITIILQQLLTVFSRRGRFESMIQNGIFAIFSNMYLNIAIIISIAATFASIYIPFMGQYLNLRPPTMQPVLIWLFPLVPAIVTIAYHEIRKYLIRKHGPDSWWAQWGDY